MLLTLALCLALTNSTTLIFLLFFSLPPKEAGEQQEQCQAQCQDSLGTRGDENGRKRHADCTQGVDIDDNLMPKEVEAIALRLVKQILSTVGKNKMFYVAAAHQYREAKEAYASASTLGGSLPLLESLYPGRC